MKLTLVRNTILRKDQFEIRTSFCAASDQVRENYQVCYIIEYLFILYFLILDHRFSNYVPISDLYTCTYTCTCTLSLRVLVWHFSYQRFIYRDIGDGYVGKYQKWFLCIHNFHTISKQSMKIDIYVTVAALNSKILY